MDAALSPQQLTAFAVLLATVALLASGRLRPDLIAVLALLTLAYTGLLSPEEALAGFGSQPAVVLLAIFVLSAALRDTGVADQIGAVVARLGGGSRPRLTATTMAAVGLVSAVTQPLQAIALLLAPTLGVCRERGVAPSRLVLPLLEAACLAAPITLVGVPALLIASSVLVRAGRPALGVLALAPIGLALLALGTLLVVLLGRLPGLLPDRGQEGSTGPLRLSEYFTELRVREDSPFVGRTVAELEASGALHVFVTGWLRDGRALRAPFGERRLEAGDVLLVRTTPEEIVAIQREPGVELLPVAQYTSPMTPGRNGHTEDPDTFAEKLVQAILAPGSELAGRSLGDLDFRRRYGAVVVGLWRRRGWLNEQLSRIRLRAGDVLVVQGDEESLARVAADRGFLMMVPFEGVHRRRSRAALAVGIVLATVVVAASGWLSIAIATLAGAAAVVLTGCLPARQAYRAIDARAYVFVAGAIPLGLALEKTGAAGVAAGWLLAVVGAQPGVVLAVLFALAALTSQLLTDVACVAVLAPLAVGTAQALGRAPEAFVVTVGLAAVVTVLTPFGPPVGQLIAGPGRYRLADFLRLGLPLTTLSGVVVVGLAQALWPV